MKLMIENQITVDIRICQSGKKYVQRKIVIQY